MRRPHGLQIAFLAGLAGIALGLISTLTEGILPSFEQLTGGQRSRETACTIYDQTRFSLQQNRARIDLAIARHELLKSTQPKWVFCQRERK